MSDQVSMLPPYVCARTSVSVLAGLFFLTAATSWTAVGVSFAEMQLYGAMGAGQVIDATERLAHTRAGEIIHAAQIACGLVTAVGFLVWLHRARVNVRALGARRLRFRREWTILGFLIPGLNLVRPYQVVQEIWQASDPSVGDPIAWKRVRTPPLLAFWWAAFLGYLALEVGSGTLLSIVSGLSRIQLAYGIGMAADACAALTADACAALSASLGYFVVVRISDAQEEKLERWGRIEPTQNLALDPRDALA
jgi:hypothetical protein